MWGMMNAMADSVEPGVTIRCQQLVELVSDYLEAALDDATAGELAAHLDLCGACAEYVRQMRTTLRMVGRVPLESLSPGVRADLIAAFSDFPTS